MQELPFPLRLQRRAGPTLRAHVAREAFRILGLLTGDVAAVLCLKALVRGVRDARWFGVGAGEIAGTVLPPGLLFPFEFLAAVITGLLIVGAYRPGDMRRDAARLFAGTALGLALIFWGRIWTAGWEYSAVSYLLAVGVVGSVIVLERSAIDAMVRRHRAVGVRLARVLVVGPADDARWAMRQMALRDSSYALIGYLDTGPHPEWDALGEISDLARVIERHRIETVILSGAFDRDTAAGLINLVDSAGCEALSMPHAVSAGFVPRVVWYRGVPLVRLTRPDLRASQLAVKRAFDVIAALAGLVVLSPLYLVIAATVRVSSPGPAIFRQVRVGRGGRQFSIYKFRSMTRDAESRRGEVELQNVYGDERLFKAAHDPRMTKLGAILRRTSLDELPQLWNVLRGDMSLVGPRPPLPTEVARYEEHQYARFEMKPGLTGPWQVGGRNTITRFEDVIRLETDYMRHWHLGKDLAILLRTLPVVMKMDGAH